MTDNPTSEDLRKAVALLKEGNLSAARLVLVNTVTQHPRDELGWFLLSFAVTEPEHQRDCLQRVLRINPTNAKARERLVKLGGEAPPEPIPQPVTPPFVEGEGEAPSPGPAPVAPMPSAEPAHSVPEAPPAPPVGLPDHNVTPVFIEEGGQAEEEAPEEPGEEEAPEQEKVAEPASAVVPPAPEPEPAAGPVAAPVEAAPAPAMPVAVQPPTRARPRLARARRERAPGWMVAAIVLLSLIIVLGGLDLGWTYYRSGAFSVQASSTVTPSQTSPGPKLPPTPVMVLPPAWTETPTPSLTPLPTATSTPTAPPSETPAATSPTPSAAAT